MCEISYENGKGIQQNLAKFAQILGILCSTFKPTLVQNFSRIKVFNALDLPHYCYMETKFGPLEKGYKTIDKSRDEIFQKNGWLHLFYHKRNEEILEELKVEPA